MRTRVGRVALAAAVAVGLWAVPPRAEAATVGTLHIIGQADYGQGLSYPCNGGMDPAKCPSGQVTTGYGVTLPTGDKLAHPFLDNGKGPISMSFSGQGVGALAKGAETKCGALAGCAAAGVFNLSLSGYADGWCGLKWGKLAGTLAPGDPHISTKASPNAGVRWVEANIVNIAEKYILTGRMSNNEWLAGVFLASADSTQGGSCFNQNAKPYIIWGQVAVLGP